VYHPDVFGSHLSIAGGLHNALLDRLSRDDVNKELPIFLQIINAGVKVTTLSDGATYSSDCDPGEMLPKLLMSLLIFARANDESRMKSQRKAGSWAAKRKAALSDNKPLGGNVPKWIKVIDGKYHVDREVAAKVRAIFKDYCNGKGLYLLHKKYGIPKPTIAYWLNSGIVLGHVTVRDGGKKVEIKGHYPPIIDERTWKRAQARKAENFIARTPSGRVGFCNIFSGLLFDASGNTFDVIRQNNVRSYVSPHMGCVVRCRAMELGIIAAKLADKMVRRIVVEDDAPSPELVKIDGEIENVQTAMIDGEMVGHLLPVLKRFQERRREIEANQERRTVEKVDPSLFDALFAAPWIDDEAIGEKIRDERLKMREVIRQNVRRIDVIKVETVGWDCYVGGKIEMTDGQKLPFAFAYCSRRRGIINCDRTGFSWPALQFARWIGEKLKHDDAFTLDPPKFIKANGLTHELRAALRALPLTYTRKRTGQATATR
jgi:DNA invertase Pin-like site-specific DNA recombinase